MLCKTLYRPLIPILWILAFTLSDHILPTAFAQRSTIGYGVYNPAADFKPDFSRRDLKVAARLLKLSPDDIASLETLHDGYVAALASKSEEISAIINDAVEKAELLQDSAKLSPAHEQSAAWNAAEESIKKTFLDDLKSLLTREQEERWPLVERELRRTKLIGQGRLFGESVDVLLLLDEVDPEAMSRPRIAELAEMYAQELDRAIVARAAFVDANRDGFRTLVSENPEDAKRQWLEGLRLRKAVRDVHERFVRQFAAELSPDAGERLKELHFERAHARLLRPTRCDTYLESALDIDSLDTAQRAQLKTIADRHNNERKSLSRQIIEAERTLEENQLPTELGIALGTTSKELRNFDGKQRLPDGHPLLTLRASRYDLDKRTRADILVVLTAEQRRQIPLDGRASSAVFENYDTDDL